MTLPSEIQSLLLRRTLSQLESTWRWVITVLDVAEGQLQRGQHFDAQVHARLLHTLVYMYMFNPPPQFSRLGIQCPAPIMCIRVCVCVVWGVLFPFYSISFASVLYTCISMYHTTVYMYMYHTLTNNMCLYLMKCIFIYMYMYM